MPSNKIQSRLTKLEEHAAAVDNSHQENSVLIPALAEETDKQAVQIRLGTPKYTHYTIMVFRRSGGGFEYKMYDETLSHITEHCVLPKPSEFVADKNMTVGEYEILSRYFDNTLRRLEGVDSYRS